MPYTFNGFGTSYYGKSNLIKHRGACDACGRIAMLKSYDTQSFFCTLFFPLIPLGKKRIINDCSSCRRHRVMAFKNWKKLIRDTIEPYHHATGTEDKGRVLGDVAHNLIGLQASEAFEELMLEVDPDQIQSGDTLATIADGFMVFNDYDMAQLYAEKALQKKASTENSRRLMYLATCNHHPAIVESTFQRIIGLPSPDPETVVSGLECLVALDRNDVVAASLTKVSPEDYPQEQKDLLKAIMAHIKNPKSTEARLLKKNYRKPKRIESGVSMSERLAKSAGPAIIIPLLSLIIWKGFFSAPTVDVYLVNGISQPYKVVLNGEEQVLFPGKERKVSVTTDTLKWEVLPVDLPVWIEGGSAPIDSTFWQRVFFSNTAHVVNPDKCALLIYEKIQYRPTVGNYTHADPIYRLDTSKSYWTYKVDYPFGEFPDEIDLGERTMAWKDRVILGDQSEITNFHQWLYEDNGADAAFNWIHARALADPHDYETLSIAVAMDPDNTLNQLKPALDHRPPLVEIHRLFQESQKANLDPADIEAMYKQIAADYPNDANAAYLYARSHTDKEEALRLFKEASQMAPPSAYAYYALSYDQRNKGEGEEALALLKKAIRLDPGNKTFQSQLEERQMAAGKHADLLPALAKKATGNPYSYYDQEAAIVLNAHMGRDNMAEKLVNRYQGLLRQESGMEPVVKQQIIRQLRFASDYASITYNPNRYERYKRPLEYTDYMIATTKGDYETCLAYLNTLEEEWSGESLVVMTLLAYQTGRTEQAEVYLNQFLELVKQDSESYPTVKRWLTADTPPSYEEVRDFEADPLSKRYYIAILAAQHPDLSLGFAVLQKKMNYRPEFPSRLLKL